MPVVTVVGRVMPVIINGRTIGPGFPAYIIAEAGSNHNGRLEQAKQLIQLAASSGADAVKFQLFRASKLYPKTAGRSDYLNDARSIYDIVAEVEMPYEWVPELAHACRHHGVTFLASAFDEESADCLDPFVPAHKIASYEMTHLPLVRHVANKGKPVMLSNPASQSAQAIAGLAARISGQTYIPVVPKKSFFSKFFGFMKKR